MKVNELRAALGKYDADTLREIAVELYKMIPKSQKENNGIDDLLLDFNKEKIKQDKKETPVNFEALKAEIEQFLVYAELQYYFAPNKHVRKEKRSKWRFEVKRFIKDLIRVGGENSEEAGNLLANIYSMLSYGCNYYIFSTEDPFSAVGYEQKDLLLLVLNKIFYSGYTPGAIKAAVFLTLDSNLNWNTYQINLLSALVGVFKTTDTRETALSQCAAYRDGYSSYQASKKFFKYPGTKNDYRCTEHRNYAVELYLMLKFSLHEYDGGINYYWKNFEDTDKEVKLYRLLWYFLGGEGEQMNALWIREYEKAVAGGIKPRDSLRDEYAHRITAQK
ncbi:MAG: hypothetical protein FWD23_03685 [Oscillospiraceae bacterium]|nr:hypothetical protein [Oscillospiraceae bacterium]